MLNRTLHPIDPSDMAPSVAFRAAMAPRKGVIVGPEARPMFDAGRSATPIAAGVWIELGSVGGVTGLWCRVAAEPTSARLLFLHGGGYMLGSSAATANFASHLAAGSGADAFVADYRLAPEHPFPAAYDDALAAYRGLAASPDSPVIIAGESAGGGLALAVLATLTDGDRKPEAVAVMSPWTDLTLNGESYISRAEADPIFSCTALAALAKNYLQGENARDLRASPLFGPVMPTIPIRIDVGEDEVLLADSIAFATRVASTGAAVTLDIWQGMPHVFQARVGQLAAARQSFERAGQFLRDALPA
ncbi:alpha/beta hydrolase fold domain-containing protein [Methylobacterium sp. J-070]|uniref:alpha/beta hydrolase fold domain-containing protein n=1 Tax=Methylobacterium sp. J-070 TaxID=2836650 RepID=UPI001FBA2399|nr:alpha/beta hydrolase fold domain-containing protein [Methylobacterium sp. J-070]MCJ2048413.1 alpha/beta hydrolase [Methylobacterium sp. J-070]